MLRKYLRNTFLSTLGSIKVISEGVHILNSHYISRNSPSKERFEELLKSINNKADIINFQDAVEVIGNKNFNSDKLVAFSFDDGFDECYTMIAPALQKYDVNAAFFINPGFVDGSDSYVDNFCKNVVHIEKNPMSWQQIKELHNNGFIIGNHTYDHHRLSGGSFDLYYNQIVESKIVIERNIKGECNYFAWPYGNQTDISDLALELALESHKYIFAAQGADEYLFKGMDRVFNRRHIEGDWPISHLQYFLSNNKVSPL